MWQRFTERARRTILRAQIEAEKVGSSFVDREHLLLGLLQESDGAALQILRAMQVSLKDAEREVRGKIAALEKSSAAPPKLTPQAKRILELSADEARRLRHDYIGTEHLLLALLRGRDNVAQSVLKVSRDEARAATVAYLNGADNAARREKIAAQTPPKPRTLWDVLRRR